MVTLEKLIWLITSDDDYVSLGQLEAEAGDLDESTITTLCGEIERGLREGRIRIGQVGGATFFPYDVSIESLLARVGRALVQDARARDYHDIWFDIVDPE